MKDGEVLRHPPPSQPTPHETLPLHFADRRTYTDGNARAQQKNDAKKKLQNMQRERPVTGDSIPPAGYAHKMCPIASD